jgi:hypothetical protein
MSEPEIAPPEADEAPVATEPRPIPEGMDERRERRPLLERVGMAAIALVLAALFGGVAVAAWSGGEIFLAAMGAIGCLMTLWVGGLTLFRG